MSRIYSVPGSSEEPLVDRDAILKFFDQRAEKIDSVGPVRAVIYQDKNAGLAEKRDVAEKSQLLPLLRMDGTQRVLDVGCGTGRWASDLMPVSAWYHGIDACKGLVDYARQHFAAETKCRFTVASVDAFSLEGIGEYRAFDRVLCAGVLMYLNDFELHAALQCIADAVSPNGLVMFREPMGVEQRLTISKHYSEEMEQDYSAIYRTGEELETMISQVMPESDFRLVGRGDVYHDPTLNNRSDTKQQWLLLERKK